MVHRRIESMDLDMPEKKGGIWWDAKSVSPVTLLRKRIKRIKARHLFLARKRADWYNVCTGGQHRHVKTTCHEWWLPLISTAVV